MALVASRRNNVQKMQVFVWDCLDRPVSLYTAFCNRTNQLYGKTGYRQTALKLRNASSNKCSLYCFFLIHYMAKTPCELSQIDEKLKLCREIERIRFINDKYNTLFRYTLLWLQRNFHSNLVFALIRLSKAIMQKGPGFRKIKLANVLTHARGFQKTPIFVAWFQ